jgi:hypothetical protein
MAFDADVAMFALSMGRRRRTRRFVFGWGRYGGVCDSGAACRDRGQSELCGGAVGCRGGRRCDDADETPAASATTPSTSATRSTPATPASPAPTPPAAAVAPAAEPRVPLSSAPAILQAKGWNLEQLQTLGFASGRVLGRPGMDTVFVSDDALLLGFVLRDGGAVHDGAGSRTSIACRRLRPHSAAHDPDLDLDAFKRIVKIVEDARKKKANP